MTDNTTKGHAMKKTMTSLLIAGSLALPAVATASDSGLAAIGQKSVRATLRYANCGDRLCRVKATTAFINADTQMLKYMNRRVRNGEIDPGSACFRQALAWSNLPTRSLPWKLGMKWLQGSISDTAFANAQIRWLQQAVKVAAAC